MDLNFKTNVQLSQTCGSHAFYHLYQMFAFKELFDFVRFCGSTYVNSAY